MDRIWNIPIDDHLVKFTIKELFAEQKPPFKVEERSLLGKQILFYLIDKRESKFEDKENEADFKGTLPIVLSTTLKKRSPNLAKLSRLNSFLDDQFKSYLRAWAKGQIDIGSNRYHAVIRFMDYYKLDKDKLVDRYYQWIMRIDNKPYKQHKNQEN